MNRENKVDSHPSKLLILTNCRC